MSEQSDKYTTYPARTNPFNLRYSKRQVTRRSIVIERTWKTNASSGGASQSAENPEATSSIEKRTRSNEQCEQQNDLESLHDLQKARRDLTSTFDSEGDNHLSLAAPSNNVKNASRALQLDLQSSPQSAQALPSAQFYRNTSPAPSQPINSETTQQNVVPVELNKSRQQLFASPNSKTSRQSEGKTPAAKSSRSSGNSLASDNHNSSRNSVFSNDTGSGKSDKSVVVRVLNMPSKRKSDRQRHHRQVSGDTSDYDSDTSEDDSNSSEVHETVASSPRTSATLTSISGHTLASVSKGSATDGAPVLSKTKTKKDLKARNIRSPFAQQHSTQLHYASAAVPENAGLDVDMAEDNRHANSTGNDNGRDPADRSVSTSGVAKPTASSSGAQPQATRRALTYDASGIVIIPSTLTPPPRSSAVNQPPPATASPRLICANLQQSDSEYYNYKFIGHRHQPEKPVYDEVLERHKDFLAESRKRIEYWIKPRLPEPRVTLAHIRNGVLYPDGQEPDRWAHKPYEPPKVKAKVVSANLRRAGVGVAALQQQQQVETSSESTANGAQGRGRGSANGESSVVEGMTKVRVATRKRKGEKNTTTTTLGHSSKRAAIIDSSENDSDFEPWNRFVTIGKHRILKESNKPVSINQKAAKKPAEQPSANRNAADKSKQKPSANKKAGNKNKEKPSANQTAANKNVDVVNRNAENKRGKRQIDMAVAPMFEL